MVKNKTGAYVIIGMFMMYYSFNDKTFGLYNMITFMIGVSAFVTAYFEYTKHKK